MRQEIVTCDSCGQDITNSAHAIFGHNASVTLREEGWNTHVVGMLAIDACSWECFFKKFEERIYLLASDYLTSRRVQIKKNEQSKKPTSIEGDDDES